MANFQDLGLKLLFRLEHQQQHKKQTTTEKNDNKKNCEFPL